MDYFKKEEAEQFSFIKIPRIMLTDAPFSNLSKEAVILYGILLERMELARDNEWIDSENRVYVIMPIDSIMEMMAISNKKAVQMLSELEQVGLIEKYRQGSGMPNRIYVKNFSLPVLIAEM